MPGDFGDKRTRREYKKSGQVVTIQAKDGFEVYRPRPQRGTA
jgi:hypothetical protein